MRGKFANKSEDVHIGLHTGKAFPSRREIAHNQQVIISVDFTDNLTEETDTVLPAYRQDRTRQQKRSAQHLRLLPFSSHGIRLIPSMTMISNLPQPCRPCSRAEHDMLHFI